MKVIEGIRLAFYFGIGMGILSTISMGIYQGVLSLIVGGPVFGLLMYLFANSKTVKNQIELESDYLLEGEYVIISKSANLIIKPKEFEMERFAFDDLGWMVGLKDKEGVGGKLYLTNYRLVFKSHKVNRLRGVFSVFLPTIKGVRNSSYFITRKLTLETYTTEIEVVLFDVKQMIGNIQSQLGKLNESEVEHLRELVIQNPNKLTDGLSKWDSFNTLNNILRLRKPIDNSVKLFLNPIGAIGSYFMNELLDKTISERWQEKFK